MLHFIVDGYNLINKIPTIRNFSLQEKRLYLISLLEEFKRKISTRNKISIIFDGRNTLFSRKSLSRSIEVVFSRGEEADSLIKKLVRNSKNPGSLIVVTEDKSIISYVKNCGVSCKKSSEFLRELKKKVKRETSDIDDNFKISSSVAYQITEELRKIWEEKY